MLWNSSIKAQTFMFKGKWSCFSLFFYILWMPINCYSLLFKHFSSPNTTHSFFLENKTYWKFYNCFWLYPNTIFSFPLKVKVFFFQFSIDQKFQFEIFWIYRIENLFIFWINLSFTLHFPTFPSTRILFKSICMEYFLSETKEEEFYNKNLSATTTLIIIKICQFFI